MFKKEKEITIRDFVNAQLTTNQLILDDTNAIVIIRNDKKEESDIGFKIIHERLENNGLIEVNHWYTNVWYFDTGEYVHLPKLHLFKIQNGREGFNGLYDYIEDKLVVPQGIWDEIRSDNYLEKYNGFFASFEIHSDYEEGDVLSYINPVTNERIKESLGAQEKYYAILNLDGTIRGNKLFKGNSFSKIEEIIDLDEYESMEALKQERKEICNQIKQRNKQYYQEMIAGRNDGSISPYLDNEVMHILEMKK